MDRISRIYSAKPVSEDAESTLIAFDSAIREAIQTAREAGILQGFMVSILAGYFIQETNTLNGMTAE